MGSTSRILALQIDESFSSSHNRENSPSSIRTSTEFLYRPTTSVSHHRSNTVPARYRKSDEIKPIDQQHTHLSPTYHRNENNSQKSISSSLVQLQPKRHIRSINDGTDDVESPSSSIIHRVQ
jgi:hypothetical protein